jgi:hypothetical protein
MADAFSPLTARIDQYATALRLTGGSAATFERKVGPVLKKEVQIAAVAAFGADLKPFKNKGVKAGFGYDTEPVGNGVRIVLKLRPQGVWAFGEHGAAPHLIGGGRRKKGGSFKGGYVKAATAAHPVRGPVLHPGTDGKRAIKYAFKRVRQAQHDAVRAGVHAVIQEVKRSG